jgi:UDP-GlcNAc:undecaprenyl-phosphate GlcNAc-1-phosphate transferase
MGISFTPGLILLATAVGLAILVCVNARYVGANLRVLSHPDSHRRKHRVATPQVGGIAIMLGLVVWLGGTLLTEQVNDRNFLMVLLFSAVGIGAIGFADDQHEVSPMARILLLAVFMNMAFSIAPQLITSQLQWGSFLPTYIPVWAYVPLMCASAVGLVNAVNMADGQDGIAGGLYAIWTACLVIVTSGPPAATAGLLFALVLIFLSFNLFGRLFLGDCGSYGVTFVIGLLVTLAHARGQISLDTVMVWFFIPVMDCVRLLISRPLRGRSPFEGDRDHFHHRLEDRVGKRLGLMIYVITVAVTSVIATVMPRFALVCLCALCAFYFSFAWLTDAELARREAETEEEHDSKVLPIAAGAGKHRDVRH